MGTITIRLLVVEDDDTDPSPLPALLARQRIDASCERVGNAPDMVARLADGRFDAVICDHAARGLRCADALAAWQAGGRTIPFVIVADRFDEPAVVDALHAGADDFVSRDRLDRLGPALRRAIDDARARRERARDQQALEASEARLRALSAYLQSAVENERKAIAREIHDDIGGMLTALRFDLDWMSRHSQGEVAQRAQQALDTVGQAMLASQRISRNLRPPVLEAGVVAAVEWQVSQFRKRTGLRAAFSSNVDRVTLDDARAIAVYRCVQEALTNIVKHANARSVSVDLILRQGQLSIEVTDDGRGLGQTDLNKPASFGLRGLSERARAVDGWLDVLPSAEGTTILLTIPLDGARSATEARAS